jgi:Permease MlaE
MKIDCAMARGGSPNANPRSSPLIRLAIISVEVVCAAARPTPAPAFLTCTSLRANRPRWIGAAPASVREMACIMTGTIMCGRTGAAFAAQPGIMKVNQEIEAFQTSASPPFEFLVLPGTLALILMMPLLCPVRGSDCHRPRVSGLDRDAGCLPVALSPRTRACTPGSGSTFDVGRLCTAARSPGQQKPPPICSEGV